MNHVLLTSCSTFFNCLAASGLVRLLFKLLNSDGEMRQNMGIEMLRNFKTQYFYCIPMLCVNRVFKCSLDQQWNTHYITGIESFNRIGLHTSCVNIVINDLQNSVY